MGVVELDREKVGGVTKSFYWFLIFEGVWGRRKFKKELGESASDLWVKVWLTKKLKVIGQENKKVTPYIKNHNLEKCDLSK